jgi:hypothetical protein
MPFVFDPEVVHNIPHEFGAQWDENWRRAINVKDLAAARALLVAKRVCTQIRLGKLK